MTVFDLEKECSSEAKRCLRLLGDLADAEYNYDRARDRAKAVGVPFRIWKRWLDAYKADGLEGLMPDWEELNEKTETIVLERREQLGDEVNADTIPPNQIREIANRNGWTYRRAKKWVHRYRIGGLWSLAPQNNPYQPRRPAGHKQAPATLDENMLNKIYERREILGDLADQVNVTNEDVKQRAEETGKSERTIWNYLGDYRRYGLAGLAPRQRSDKGKRHGISDRMIMIVEGIRLSQKDIPENEVYKQACEKAKLLGEVEPTTWQVHAICTSIPKYIRQKADRREPAFRNSSRFTYPIRFTRTVYQVDHTLVDVLVKDKREARYRRKSGETRLWLTLIMDSRSRLVMAGRFGYDRPDRHVVAAAIRDSLLVTKKKPFGGKPKEIWVDHGKELLSDHIHQFTRELGIELYPCPPHQPQLKGIVERFFGTLNTRLWATLEGYVNSNTVKRNPHAKAKLTPLELVNRFWSFIEEYHNEVHSSTGMTPLAFWNEQCVAAPVDPRLLDMLLKEQTTHKVLKEGIKCGGRKYWHSALADLVGERLLVRAAPSYMAPDEIEVFRDGKWVCTAFALDSAIGMSVTREQIRSAQRDQRRSARHRINEARAALKEAENEINKAEKDKEESKPPSPPSKSDDEKRRSESRRETPRRKNLFDRMKD